MRGNIWVELHTCFDIIKTEDSGLQCLLRIQAGFLTDMRLLVSIAASTHFTVERGVCAPLRPRHNDRSGTQTVSPLANVRPPHLFTSTLPATDPCQHVSHGICCHARPQGIFGARSARTWRRQQRLTAYGLFGLRSLPQDSFVCCLSLVNSRPPQPNMRAVVYLRTRAAPDRQLPSTVRNQWGACDRADHARGTLGSVEAHTMTEGKASARSPKP